MNSRIAFLGCGSMGSAIMVGLLKSGTDPGNVSATVKSAEKASVLRSEYGVSVVALEEDPDANVKTAGDADVVVLGTKPYAVADLAREISPALRPDCLVISVAAAISLNHLAEHLPAGQPVVRAIPNTPLKVRRGVVGLSSGTYVTDIGAAKAVFEGSGIAVEIPEDLQDAMSAISGSGPAYAFYLVEAMAEAARELGLDEHLADLLARETLAGAGALLTAERLSARQLRRNVTSPAGTTEQAIATFDQAGLKRIVASGARAAAARAAVMASEYESS